MSEGMQHYCQKAYRGGLTDNFARGEIKDVISIDINSSYPFQMFKVPFPIVKYDVLNINAPYK